jgi:hypothetical protein
VRAASTLSHLRALAALLALVALGLVAAAASPGTAAAASACAKRVVDDWFDNGRVDNLYPLHCYREAIKSLPGDARDYSSAEEDIRRALQYATRGKSDPGDAPPPAPGPSPAPSPAPAPPASPPPPPSTTAANPPPAPPSPTTSAPEPEPVGTGTQTEAGGPVDAAGASSIPMPLIVLGGLALLLLAAGSAGYVTRRLQSRGGNGGEPPAAT